LNLICDTALKTILNFNGCGFYVGAMWFGRYQHFGGICCLHLRLPSSMKMEAAASCKMLSIHLLTWCQSTEDLDLNTHCHVNLNSTTHFSNLKLHAAFCSVMLNLLLVRKEEI